MLVQEWPKSSAPRADQTSFAHWVPGNLVMTSSAFGGGKKADRIPTSRSYNCGKCAALPPAAQSTPVNRTILALLHSFGTARVAKSSNHGGGYLLEKQEEQDGGKQAGKLLKTVVGAHGLEPWTSCV
jgi:hypothetical protein